MSFQTPVSPPSWHPLLLEPTLGPSDAARVAGHGHPTPLTCFTGCMCCAARSFFRCGCAPCPHFPTLPIDDPSRAVAFCLLLGSRGGPGTEETGSLSSLTLCTTYTRVGASIVSFSHTSPTNLLRTPHPRLLLIPRVQLPWGRHRPLTDIYSCSILMRNGGGGFHCLNMPRKGLRRVEVLFSY
jgi:hypothetical protein